MVTFTPNQYNLGVAPIGRNMDRYDIPYKGRLLAWDPVARKPRWTVEYGNYWNGGTLATAGNLVFQGTASGDFYAYRATDGQQLWSSWAGTGIVAPPISYMIDGRQYVSVMAGWGGAFSKKARSYGRLLTFAIGGTAALPSRPRPRTVTAIAHSGTPQQITAGAKIFATYCARCHGGASPRTGGDGRAAGALQCGNAAGVIVMAVGIDDQLDVFGLEAQLADVRVDDRGRLFETTVEQHVAGVADDQDRRQAVGADVVAVAEQLERLARLVPLVAAVALVRRIGLERWRLKNRDQQQEETGNLHVAIVPCHEPALSEERPIMRWSPESNGSVSDQSCRQTG